MDKAKFSFARSRVLPPLRRLHRSRIRGTINLSGGSIDYPTGPQHSDVHLVGDRVSLSTDP
jgi:hypothetical protein